MPNLSLVSGQQVQPQPSQPSLTSPSHARRPSEEPQEKTPQYNTAPAQPVNGYVVNGGFRTDEFGAGVGLNNFNTVSGGTLPTSTVPSRYVDPRTGSSSGRRPGSSGGGRPGSSSTRPGSSGGRNRLLVANMGDEIPEESPVNTTPTSPPIPTSPPQFSPQHKQQQQRWLTAEEEKKRLYDVAVARVEQVQGIQSAPPPEQTPPPHQVCRTSRPAIRLLTLFSLLDTLMPARFLWVSTVNRRHGVPRSKRSSDCMSKPRLL